MRDFLRKYLVQSRLRSLARPVYNGVVATELAGMHLVDHFKPRPAQHPQLPQVTAIIKTFERPKILQRLIQSIRYFYPTLKIIIVDDSKSPSSLSGVKMIVLPFDSGVSAGRQTALDAVETEFLLLLDDDFIFFHATQLADSLQQLIAYPQVDIVGGAVVNLPLFQTNDYSNVQLLSADGQSIQQAGTLIGGMPVYDKVPNFYIGRTESIRKVGWTPELKRVEHADFFTRAQGVLLSVFNAKMRVLHAKTIFDDKYMSYRNDFAADYGILQSRYWNDR